MRSVVVLTSGGDAPGMNAALRAMAKICAARGVRLTAALDGYEGLIDGRFRPLVDEREGVLLPSADLELAGGIGGTLIGSARSARFREPDGRARAARQLEGHEGLLVIGGNGSLTGAHALAQEHGIRVVGLPASIDNDVGCTATAIGVDTALNTIIEACDRISDTARAHRRAFVVEVMGRACGYLAMASAVATGADAVLFREQGRSEAELVDAVTKVVREGLRNPNKRRILILEAEGVGVPSTELVRAVEARLAPELPDVGIRATVLGHVVRGGRPSAQDRMVAGRLAFAAVEALLGGATDEMVAWNSPLPGGTKTQDPSVQRFSLERVLEETRVLLDGTGPVTKRRIELLASVEGVLAL